jgi:hypothetical protein
MANKRCESNIVALVFIHSAVQLTGMSTPTRGQRIGFWLLLGLTSTAFAEVLFPTTPFEPVTLLLFAVPTYLLHSVVLAAVVYRANRVNYATLYLAGILLGLYEAYVTKVLWAPLGDRPTLEVGGLFVFETLGLLFFWHSIVAFVLPVVVIETVATSSSWSLQPPLVGHRFSRPLAVAVAVYLLLFQGSFGGPSRALLGNTIALTVLVTALFLWRQTDGHTQDMQALLPSGTTLAVLSVTLVVVSAGLSAWIRPEELPTEPLPHLLVLSMYLVVGGLLAVLLRSDDPQSTGVSLQFSWRRILGAAGSVIVASPVLGLVGAQLLLPVFLSYYVVAVVVGLAGLRAVASELWS